MEIKQEFLNNRVLWRSELSFIIVTAGAAIGLGNLWQFPVLVTHQGGLAFFLLYLLCLFGISMPAMLAEMVIGRRGSLNSVSSFERLAFEGGLSRRWSWLGWWGIVTLLLIASFYSVVCSLSLDYVYRFIHAFTATGQPTFSLSHILANPHEMVLWHSVFIALTVLVLIRGLRHGLEPISYITVFGLFFLLLLLIGAMFVRSPHLLSRLHPLFVFNWHQLTWHSFFWALSYAFFTLSIGAGTMLVYGSYLPLSANLGRAGFAVVVLDLLVAVLACIAIGPLLLAHPAAQGSSLNALYSFLPNELMQLGHFRIEGLLFYFVVFLAGWTSMIAFVEPLVILCNERFNIPRRWAAPLIGAFIWGLGLVSVFSFNLWKHVHVLGQHSLFDAVTYLSTGIMLPIGSMGFCVFAGWQLSKRASSLELNARRCPRRFETWHFLIRYLAPLGILVLLISQI